MSTYHNGIISLTQNAMKNFIKKLNYPSELVKKNRNNFLENINKNVVIISSNNREVVAKILDFDDSFIK